MKETMIIFTGDPQASAQATFDALIEEGKGVTILEGGEVINEMDGHPDKEHITIQIVGGKHEACEDCDWLRYDPDFLQRDNVLCN